MWFVVVLQGRHFFNVPWNLDIQGTLDIRAGNSVWTKHSVWTFSVDKTVAAFINVYIYLVWGPRAGIMVLNPRNLRKLLTAPLPTCKSRVNNAF